MDNLFIVLILISIVCFVIGLINPKIFRFLKSATRKTTSLLFGLILVGSFIGFAITSTPSQPSNTENEQSNTPVISFVFDVPTLLGKNIDQVRTILGNPENAKDLLEPTAQQLNLGAVEWDNTFKKDGYELLVTFNPKTRKVIDYFIPTIAPAGSTKDVSDLIKIANLDSTSKLYTIESVKVIKDPKSFTGIKITLK